MRIPNESASIDPPAAGPAKLIDDVRAACRRLAGAGWEDLFRRHGLDITASDLAVELRRELPGIDRAMPGFEDFSHEGRRAIEPGRPAQSLLFHALASPHVLETGSGAPLAAFPTPAEIEAVENYVYGVRPPSIHDLRVRAGDAPLAIVVFAVEYRQAINTVHQRHADVCFSRTGVSRIGIAESLYLPDARGYLPFVEDDEHGIRVIPCRYAAYIAAQSPGRKDDFGPMRFRDEGDVTRDFDGTIRTVHVAGDDQRGFWVPLHKLFTGPECLRGVDLEISLTAYQVNQKLRKVHQAFAAQGFDTGWHEPELGKPPFVFHDGLAAFSTVPSDGRGLLVPTVHPTLVEAATLDGKVVTYRVPTPRQGRKNETFSSSLEVLARKSGARSAPEYVHARHAVNDDGTERNLNDEADVQAIVEAGGYRAKHYIDFTADGWIDAECRGISLEIPRVLPAYSLVAPPDFFPAVKQQELMQWWRQSAPPDLAKNVWPKNPGPPETLCDIRYPANLTLLDQNERRIFDPADNTVSAIVSMRGAGGAAVTQIDPARTLRTTWLPDGAAGVFAPGWDTSIDRTEEQDPSDDGILVLPGTTHLSGYGLGSPFPEDAKLCAALSSFWPAAAPDVSRTFEPRNYATATPLPDDIIGQGGGVPWDGIRGPIISEANPHEIEYTSLAYGDYVEAALEGRFSPAAIARTSASEYVARTLAMARVYQLLEADTTEKKSGFGVFSFTPAPPELPERIAAEQAAGQALSPAHTFRFAVYKVGDKRTGTGSEFRKTFVKFDELQVIFADPVHAIRYSTSDKRWYASRY